MIFLSPGIEIEPVSDEDDGIEVNLPAKPEVKVCDVEDTSETTRAREAEETSDEMEAIEAVSEEEEEVDELITEAITPPVADHNEDLLDISDLDEGDMLIRDSMDSPYPCISAIIPSENISSSLDPGTEDVSGDENAKSPEPVTLPEVKDLSVQVSEVDEAIAGDEIISPEVEPSVNEEPNNEQSLVAVERNKSTSPCPIITTVSTTNVTSTTLSTSSPIPSTRISPSFPYSDNIFIPPVRTTSVSPVQVSMESDTMQICMGSDTMQICMGSDSDIPLVPATSVATTSSTDVPPTGASTSTPTSTDVAPISSSDVIPESSFTITTVTKSSDAPAISSTDTPLTLSTSASLVFSTESQPSSSVACSSASSTSNPTPPAATGLETTSQKKRKVEKPFEPGIIWIKPEPVEADEPQVIPPPPEPVTSSRKRRLERTTLSSGPPNVTASQSTGKRL